MYYAIASPSGRSPGRHPQHRCPWVWGLVSGVGGHQRAETQTWEHTLEEERERGGASGYKGGKRKYAKKKQRQLGNGRERNMGDGKSSRKQFRGRAETEMGKGRGRQDGEGQTGRGGADRTGMGRQDGDEQTGRRTPEGLTGQGEERRGAEQDREGEGK